MNSRWRARCDAVEEMCSRSTKATPYGWTAAGRLGFGPLLTASKPLILGEGGAKPGARDALNPVKESTG